MEAILKTLQLFLPTKAYETPSQYEENMFDLFDEVTDEEIGCYSINENGELISFIVYAEEASGHLAKDQAAQVAEKFIDAFHYEKKKEYELSAILDFDKSYIIIYEKREEKYGLFLPNTGFSVTVTTSGLVVNFSLSDEDYVINNADVVISKEEAKKRYVESLDFELAIQKLDEESYKNGDDAYHLTYSVIEHLMDIPADGKEPVSIKEEHNVATIAEQPSPTKSIYQLIGLTSAHKLVDVHHEAGKRTEIWSTLESVQSFTFDMDGPDYHVIKLCFDEETGMLQRVVSGEAFEHPGEELSMDDAKQRAVDLMFSLFPDANKRFKLEALEEPDPIDDDELEEEEDLIDLDDDEDPEEYDDEDCYAEEEEDIEFESTYTFYFHLFHEGIRVDQNVTMIEVGKYSGKITNVDLALPETLAYLTLPSKPVISYEEAKEIYQRDLEMELTFIRESDEQDNTIYSLSYVPAFPKTVGHVRVIDAITGEAIYVNVGDAVFL